MDQTVKHVHQAGLGSGAQLAQELKYESLRGAEAIAPAGDKQLRLKA